MPLSATAEASIRSNLEMISRGERPRVVEIGFFTPVQFAEINRSRTTMRLNELGDNTILFLGRHLHVRRSADGYTIDDMIMQIKSALSVDSLISLDQFRSVILNPAARADGYGNHVHDCAVLEMTARRPKAELYTAYPKGDVIKPQNAQRLA